MKGKRRKVSRKYKIKDDNMIRYIVSCLNSLNQEEITMRLDEYERVAIRRKAMWARQASIEEIMTIMSKLGFPFIFVGMDERFPTKSFELRRGAKEYHRTGNVDKLMELAANHKFFTKAGRDVIHTLGLYSQLLNGGLYVPNKDYYNFLEIGLDSEKKIRNELKNVDLVISNALLSVGVDNLVDKDLAILFLLRKYDSAPMPSRAMYEILEGKIPYIIIQRHIAKLTQSKYLYRHGVKKDSRYSLTELGWMAVNKARKSFFHEVQFWNRELDNGSANSTEANRKHVA